MEADGMRLRPIFQKTHFPDSHGHPKPLIRRGSSRGCENIGGGSDSTAAGSPTSGRLPLDRNGRNADGAYREAVERGSLGTPELLRVINAELAAAGLEADPRCPLGGIGRSVFIAAISTLSAWIARRISCCVPAKIWRSRMIEKPIHASKQTPARSNVRPNQRRISSTTAMFMLICRSITRAPSSGGSGPDRWNRFGPETLTDGATG